MNSLADTGQTRRGKGYAINEYGGHFEVKPRPGEIAHGVKSGNLRDRRTGEMRPIRNNQEFWMGLSVPWALYSDANLEQWRSRHQKDVDDGHIEQSFLDAEYAHLKKWRETIKIRGEQKQYLESVGRTLLQSIQALPGPLSLVQVPQRMDGKVSLLYHNKEYIDFPTPGVEPVDPYMALPRAEPDNRPRINARRSDGLSPPEDVQGTEPVPQLKQVAPRPQPGFDGTVEPPATQRRIHRFPTPGVEPVDPYMALPAAQPDGRPRINARAEHGLSPPEDVQGFDRVPESLPSVAEPPAKATGVPGIDMLKVHEGFRATPYRDTEGKLTVGFGRNLDDNPLTPAERAHLGLGPNDPLTRITQEQAEYLFNNDLMSASNSAMNIFGDAWNNLNDARKSVIVNMIYNMGAGDFREFQDMIKAVKEGDWNKAAQEMLVNSAGTGPSDWAKTVGQRAQELAEIMRNR